MSTWISDQFNFNAWIVPQVQVPKGDGKRGSRSHSRSLLSWLLIIRTLAARREHTQQYKTTRVCSLLTDLLHELGRWELSSEKVFELYSGALVDQASAIVHTEKERLSLIPWCATLKLGGPGCWSESETCICVASMSTCRKPSPSGAACPSAKSNAHATPASVSWSRLNSCSPQTVI